MCALVSIHSVSIMNLRAFDQVFLVIIYLHKRAKNYLLLIKWALFMGGCAIEINEYLYIRMRTNDNCSYM